MTSFLDKVALAIRAQPDVPPAMCAVVLPSQRAAVFLRRSLAQAAGEAQWSPDILTLPTFMERIAGVRAMPMDELLFEAYEAYRLAAGAGARPFEEYLTWAPAALRDMSEADAHLVPMDGFYRDLRSWEELDWSFNTTPLSPGQERTVRYWTLAGKWHAELNLRSAAVGAGTSGWMERTAAASTGPFPWSRIWFAGLNAFTTAELAVIDRAQKSGIARFAWDADRYYLDDERQEAGIHLRQAMARFGKGEVAIDDNLRGARARIRTVQAPNNAAQAWCASEAVGTDAPDKERTAIILADGALLRPLLEALSADQGPMNITMGVPLSQLPVAALLEGFFHGIASEQHERPWAVHRAEEVLRHPFIRNSALVQPIDELLLRLNAPTNGIRSAAQWREALASLDPQAGELPAHALADTAPPYERVVALLGWAQRRMQGDALATEQLYQASLLLHRMHGLLALYHKDTGPLAWVSFLSRILRGARIGLFGEPLSGIQVMGLLESRALDHDRVVLLGAQEGQLPSASADRSFVPFEIRRHYKLPLRDSTDAVQAYNFLRILQHATEVVLVYADDGTGQGPSRFIAQLMQELPGGAGPLPHRNARAPVSIAQHLPLVVPANAARREQLVRRCASGLSPTMLSSWLRCPLDHWFKYVLGLREPDPRTASIPANVLGDAVHEAMHERISPWRGKALTAEGLEQAAAGFPATFREQLARKFGDAIPDTGQPLLQANMAERAGVAFLLGEARLAREGRHIMPVALETEYAAPLANTAIDVPVLIKGRIDRVDVRDGVHTLLDLKTGRVDPEALRIKDITTDLRSGGARDRSQALQLLLYAWLYLNCEPSVPGVRAGLLPLQRTSGSEGIFLRLGERDHIVRDDLPLIGSALASIVQDMLDPEVPIKHNPESTYCTFCTGD